MNPVGTLLGANGERLESAIEFAQNSGIQPKEIESKGGDSSVVQLIGQFHNECDNLIPYNESSMHKLEESARTRSNPIDSRVSVDIKSVRDSE